VRPLLFLTGSSGAYEEVAEDIPFSRNFPKFAEPVFLQGLEVSEEPFFVSFILLLGKISPGLFEHPHLGKTLAAPLEDKAGVSQGNRQDPNSAVLRV